MSSICVQCGKPFTLPQYIDGKYIYWHNRKKCLTCKPYPSHHIPHRCAKCNDIIPSTMSLNGKKLALNNRKYCLKCSPYNLHNTRAIHLQEIERFCLYCKNALTGNQEKFCSIQCKIKYLGQQNQPIRKANRRKNKLYFIEMLGSKCSICGINGDPLIFDFHHIISDEKKFQISTIAHYSIERIKDEIKKCILLCKNCHMELHWNASNQYQSSAQNHIKNYRKRSIDYLGSKCILCGYTQCTGSLCFHHVNASEKEFGIANSYNYKWDRIKSELEKCVLLCTNCHSLVHHNQSYKLKLEKCLRTRDHRIGT